MELLEPVTVGTHTVRNRVLFGPHVTNLGRGRSLSEAHVAYYRRRAEGGAGVIVTETASAHPLDWPYERAPLAAECGPGWEAVAAACGGPGATVVASLGHAGLQGSSAYSQRELWAPSRVPDANSREQPKAMTAEDMAEVIAGFSAGTRTAMAAGLAGVEVNAGQHSLVRQFLSGLTNQRTDEWGPDDSGLRLRFAQEVLRAVRSAAGDGIVGLRLSCDELAPWAGITPDAAALVASALAPHVDYLVVVRGSIFSVPDTRPDAHTEPGFNLGLVRQVRSAVEGRTAVVAQGSIVDWGQAEWALTDGVADLVEMTRAQIADPDLCSTLARDPGRVRRCTLCNQRCRVRDTRNPIVSCIVNPTTGYELTEPQDPPSHATAGRATVVGGGPAGMECARVLAAAGWRVRLLERSGELGGIVPTWTVAVGRERLAVAVEWLASEVERLGVEVELDHTVETADVDAFEREGHQVVLCTGSRPDDHLYEVQPEAEVRTALDVLGDLRSGSLDLSEDSAPVVVWDPVGGTVAISVAETLASSRTVELVTPDVITGTMLSATGDLASASARLARAGVKVRKHARLHRVAAGSAELEDVFTGERSTVEAAMVVDGGTRLPEDSLWQAAGRRHVRAGDAVAPRSIYEAVLEGRRAAMALAGQSQAVA